LTMPPRYSHVGLAHFPGSVEDSPHAFFNMRRTADKTELKHMLWRILSAGFSVTHISCKSHGCIAVAHETTAVKSYSACPNQSMSPCSNGKEGKAPNARVRRRFSSTAYRQSSATQTANGPVRVHARNRPPLVNGGDQAASCWHSPGQECAVQHGRQRKHLRVLRPLLRVSALTLSIPQQLEGQPVDARSAPIPELGE